MSGLAADLSNLPADLAEPVTDLAAAIGTIETQVQRLQSAPWAVMCKGLSPLEVARMHLMVSYTVNSLFYVYLKTQGLPTAGHPVLEELERVKAYIRKVKEVSQAQAQARGVAPEATNQAAAQRFISDALAGTSGRAPTAHAAGASVDADGAKEPPPPEAAPSSTEAELRTALKKLKPAGAGADADEAASGKLGALLQQHAREGGVLQGGAPGTGTAGGGSTTATAASVTPKRKGEDGAAASSEKKKKKKDKSNKAAL